MLDFTSENRENTELYNSGFTLSLETIKKGIKRSLYFFSEYNSLICTDIVSLFKFFDIEGPKARGEVLIDYKNVIQKYADKEEIKYFRRPLQRYNPETGQLVENYDLYLMLSKPDNKGMINSFREEIESREYKYKNGVFRPKMKILVLTGLKFDSDLSDLEKKIALGFEEAKKTEDLFYECPIEKLNKLE
jgi:hypothetical protein